MIIPQPFCITARLLPGIRVADVWISIETGPRNAEGRTCYTYHIDGAVEHSAFDLFSGCQGGDWREGLCSLLSFLGAAAEASEGSDNADLFPAHVMEWARNHEDDISLASCEAEESSR